MRDHNINYEIINLDRELNIDEHSKKAVLESAEKFDNIKDAVKSLSSLAEGQFNIYHNHASVFIMFDEKWNFVNVVGTQFSDKPDKYIFWRLMSEKVKIQNVHGVIWISESWTQQIEIENNKCISNPPIVGELLNVIGFDKNMNKSKITWNIIRDHNNIPHLTNLQTNEIHLEIPLAFVPVLKAMGTLDEQIFPNGKIIPDGRNSDFILII